MQMIIHPGRLTGSIIPPPSKSIMQRACAGALLHRGITVISNAGHSEDDKVALNIISQLGASVKGHHTDRVEITSSGVINTGNEIDCGESGLSARLFTPIAALSKSAITITGKEGLRRRPMHVFHELLPQLGVKLIDFNGHLPVTVHGPLQSRSLVMDSSTSSQFLSGLLFALSAVAKEPVEVEVKHLSSRPYIDLTLEVLAAFSNNINHENYYKFYVEPSKFYYKEKVTVNVEADWSSAAFWLVGAAINGNVTVENLNMESLQADRAILDVLRQCKANIDTSGSSVTTSTSALRAFEFDATDSPDLFPILSMLASYCEGESKIVGLDRLIHKESNRKESISSMLESFGVEYRIDENTLIIKGKEVLAPGTIEGYNDHRIVMAAAMGSLRASGPVAVDSASSVAKSYPEFFIDLASLGIHTSTIS
jgi:3-phosphoshikimate 1-carboxyvinyltransferase